MSEAEALTKCERDVIHTGDCLDVLADLEAESVHAVVTDPPYGLAFMGKSWDDFEPKEYQQWCEQWATECRRVLKPGGHLLAFSGTRTYHRMAVGIEDAGFEIRDKIDWLYGSGFPKALDVSKAIDKQADAEREVVGERRQRANSENSNVNYNKSNGDVEKITAPATDAAEQWDGFKTALKPGHEPVCVARKPFGQTVAENVLEHGTGALNIDGCRIGADADTRRPAGDMADTQDKYGHYEGEQTNGSATGGRYPSNVVLDADAAESLDSQVGDLAAGAHTPASDERNIYSDGDAPNSPDQRQQLDSGGPSRYFYTSKASKSERTLGGSIDNPHPTVKPTDLMEWLVKLVTAEGQTVVDPFAGSGTTCMAAKELNRQFIGIEQNAEYADIARVRVGLTPDDPSVVRDADAQNGLEAYQ